MDILLYSVGGRKIKEIVLRMTWSVLWVSRASIVLSVAGPAEEGGCGVPGDAVSAGWSHLTSLIFDDLLEHAACCMLSLAVQCL